jgi:hypothetical protein
MADISHIRDSRHIRISLNRRGSVARLMRPPHKPWARHRLDIQSARYYPAEHPDTRAPLQATCCDEAEAILFWSLFM